MSLLDRAMMARALELAERGRGGVEPNPLVGAVVVREDRIVAEGFHARFGGPHAEVVALDAAGDAARGATLYVTLEPCCHHGKTPPCTDRVLSSGVRRVVIAMSDPFPQVSGRGIVRLRNAGVAVTTGCLEAEAQRLNAPYLKLLASGRPFVHAKWAMTADGRIATATGESQWITGEAARSHAHAFRGLVDAIVVGRGTVVADDPLLTARPPGPRTPSRIVLDSELRIPADCRLVQTAREVPTLVATTHAAAPEAAERLEQAGCEVLRFPPDGAGAVDVGALLDALGSRRCTNVLVEGGPRVLGAFFAAGAIDAVRVYLAPRLVGGEAAPGPIAGAGVAHLAEALRLAPPRVTVLGSDVCLEYGPLDVASSNRTGSQ